MTKVEQIIEEEKEQAVKSAVESAVKSAVNKKDREAKLQAKLRDKQIATNLLKSGDSVDKVVQCMGLPRRTVRSLASKISREAV